MNSSINNNTSSSMQTSIGAIDRYFPTSPHFFDTPNSFPTSNATSSWAQPTAEPTTKPSTLAPGPTGRTSKKLSRASRRGRPPTTVLTTDTSNFRAMVQEFTGIPSPPFNSPLHFPRSLVNTAPPSLLLKPFPNKFQPPPTSTSPLPPINFQPQLVSMPQQQAIASSSGELRLPGVIGSGGNQTRQQQDAVASCKMNFPGSMSSVATEFHSEKGTEGLTDSWICSSD